MEAEGRDERGWEGGVVGCSVDVRDEAVRVVSAVAMSVIASDSTAAVEAGGEERGCSWIAVSLIDEDSSTGVEVASNESAVTAL